MKLNKIIVSLALVCALVIGFRTNAEAAVIKAVVTSNQPVIETRGEDVSVTITITGQNMEVFDAFGGTVTWDNTLLTYDKKPILDNIEVGPVFTEGNISEFRLLGDQALLVSSITLNFTNALADTTATEAIVDFKFNPVVNEGEVEIYYDGFGVGYEDEVTYQPSVITLNQTVTIDPTSASLIAGKTQQFTASVTNDDAAKGVVYAVAGNNSADTIIDENGLLTVGADEAIGTELTITATSVANDQKSATAKVIVIAEEIAALNRVEADKIIGMFNALDKASYTADSYKVLEDAITEVKAVLTTDAASRILVNPNQATLDAAVAVANDAYAKLVKVETPVVPVAPVKPTTPTTGNKIAETGMNAPIMAIVLIGLAGTSVIVRRKYIK